MDLFPKRWFSFSGWAILAGFLTLAVAPMMGSTSVALAQDQPNCGAVFNLGQTTGACLRVVNAGDPAAGPVDVYSDDTVLVQGLKYGDASAFGEVPSGQHQIRVVPAGKSVDQAHLDSDQNLGEGQAYQLTVSGLENPKLAPWISGVDTAPLAQGQARVRVVQASPDTDSVTVSVANGPTPFAGIPLGAQSGYVPFKAGSVEFELRLSGSSTLLLTTPAIQLKEGNNYDLYVIGESSKGTLQLVVFSTEVGTSPNVTPAPDVTPVIAVGSTPVVETAGAETPAPPVTPAS